MTVLWKTLQKRVKLEARNGVIAMCTRKTSRTCFIQCGHGPGPSLGPGNETDGRFSAIPIVATGHWTLDLGPGSAADNARSTCLFWAFILPRRAEDIWSQRKTTRKRPKKKRREEGGDRAIKDLVAKSSRLPMSVVAHQCGGYLSAASTNLGASSRSSFACGRDQGVTSKSDPGEWQFGECHRRPPHSV